MTALALVPSSPRISLARAQEARRWAHSFLLRGGKHGIYFTLLDIAREFEREAESSGVSAWVPDNSKQGRV